MKKKYNDESIYFKDWTTKKLKQEAQSLYQMIYIAECYSTRDIFELDGITAELAKRGVEPKTKMVF